MKNRSLISTVLVVVTLFVAGVAYWCNSGYGKVSHDAYEVAKALYGACLSRSDERVNQVAMLLEEADEVSASGSIEINDTERRWLNTMISTAREGNWKSAAKSARRMMEDQVER